MRRVDAVVGQGAYDFNAREHALVSQLSDKLNARPDELAERVNALLAKLKESDRRLASMYESQLAASVPALVADTKNSAAPVKVAVKNVGHFGAVDALRKTVLDVRAQLGEDAPVVVALAGVNEDDKPMVAVATNEAARKAGIKAGDLVLPMLPAVAAAVSAAVAAASRTSPRVAVSMPPRSTRPSKRSSTRRRKPDSASGVVRR